MAIHKMFNILSFAHFLHSKTQVEKSTFLFAGSINSRPRIQLELRTNRDNERPLLYQLRGSLAANKRGRSPSSFSPFLIEEDRLENDSSLER